MNDGWTAPRADVVVFQRQEPLRRLPLRVTLPLTAVISGLLWLAIIAGIRGLLS
jgi:hypothetical protein